MNKSNYLGKAYYNAEHRTAVSACWIDACLLYGCAIKFW